MAWLPTLLSNQSLQRRASGRKDAVTRRATSLASFNFGRPYLSTWDVQRAVTDGYERVIWVFRCIDAIASNAAGLDFMFRKGDPNKGDELPRHPLLTVLNRQTNPWEIHEAFIYRLVSQYLLSKRGAFVEVVYDRAGNPSALYLLPPHMTNPIPHPDTFVSGYEVLIGGFTRIVVPAVDERTGKPKVIWIRKRHPLDPYSGVTPLESAGLSIDTDYYARLFNRRFLQNDGRPGGVLAVKGDLGDDDKEELERRYAGGPDKAGRVSVISAEDATFQDLSINHRDMQYAESMNATKNDIMLAFGTPLSVLGDASGRTYDNADAEKAVFWQETMIPHLRVIAGELDCLDADLDTFLSFNTSTVTVLMRHQQAEEKRLQELFGAGLISADEFREKTGREPFDVPQARALWIPAGLTAIPAKGDEDHPAMAPPVPPNAMSPDGTPVRLGPDGRPLEPQPDENAILEHQTHAQAAIGAAAGTAGRRATDQGKLGSTSIFDPASAIVGARPRQLTALPSAKSVAEGFEVKVLDGTSHGTMVAFFLDLPTAERLALGTPDAEQPSDMHVTLAYLGKGSIDRAALQAAVGSFAMLSGPMEAMISGYGRFDIGDGEHAVYASVDAPELPEWRQRLVNLLEAHGFVPNRTHGFTPHVTLAYVDADAPDPPMPERIALRFDSVSVASGPDRQSFRLTAGQPVVDVAAQVVPRLCTNPRCPLAYAHDGPCDEAKVLVPAATRFVATDVVDADAFAEALKAAGFRAE